MNHVVLEGMKTTLIAAAASDWYADPNDPRSPHDSWLQRCELSVEGKDADEDRCERVFHLDLLSAYHNGVIRLSYRGVVRYQIVLQNRSDSAQIARRRDWLSDSVETLEAAEVRHTIDWEGERWMIECREADYTWFPDKT